MRKTAKYWCYLCLLADNCPYKRQDKKTELPICIDINNHTGTFYPCSQRYKISNNMLDKGNISIPELRRRRFGKP